MCLRGERRVNEGRNLAPGTGEKPGTPEQKQFKMLRTLSALSALGNTHELTNSASQLKVLIEFVILQADEDGDVTVLAKNFIPERLTKLNTDHRLPK